MDDVESSPEDFTIGSDYSIDGEVIYSEDWPEEVKKEFMFLVQYIKAKHSIK